MGIKFSNNGHSTLAASITSSGTSITVASGHGSRFPSLAAGDYFYATLIDASNNLEIVKCTARSSDVLTVTRGAESTTARAYAIGDRIELRVTAAGLDEAAQIYDKDSSSTGYFALPVGTTAQEPAAGSGRIRFDTDLGVVMFSDGTDWYKIAATIAQLSSVSGDIYAGASSTLTLTGSGFLTSSLVVNFTQSSDSIDVDVTVTPTSDTAASVTVPSTVYSNVTAGNSVSVQVTNSDGMSSGAVSTTAIALPSGGTVSTSGSYRIHTFTSSGTFTNTIPSLSVEYLVVAGGAGGGGRYMGGGGGAGGFRTNVSGATSGRGSSAEASMSLSATSYPVTVGGGGSGGAEDNSGSNGNNSSFNSISSLGGGGGGSWDHGNQYGLSGGCGGGNSGYSTGSGGSGTSGQGYDGGSGATYGAGGGGGAGAQGNNGSSGDGGNGGTGTQSSITGTATYYAGGGGGGDYSGTGASSGGNGGGGAGAPGPNNSSGGAPTSATANTGGGGGGANGYNNVNTSGANGGSGVVILRYQL